MQQKGWWLITSEMEIEIKFESTVSVEVRKSLRAEELFPYHLHIPLSWYGAKSLTNISQKAISQQFIHFSGNLPWIS